ncbi:hypothetical protein H1S01_15715 [Heliobacterium chlorum]|uniref:Uncharacterized protein n=1 Tax=Heliobacterium chlorum TaxID=2698 RepID=A0ABR7T7E0_HELCL|nr:hypothetical protein [Heliobacterium chlorum]MBC9785933.1 hypothetical protein [Heliobacterium chlorum]
MKKLGTITIICLTIVFSFYTYAFGYDTVIYETESGSYRCVVKKENSTYTWDLWNKNMTLEIVETPQNKSALESFMESISQLKRQTVKMYLAIGYLLICLGSIVYLAVKKKNEYPKKEAIGFITPITLITLFVIFDTAFEIQTLVTDANYYFQILSN